MAEKIVDISTTFFQDIDSDLLKSQILLNPWFVGVSYNFIFYIFLLDTPAFILRGLIGIYQVILAAVEFNKRETR